MNKEQSADDPSVDLIRVKNMLNSTIYDVTDTPAQKYSSRSVQEQFEAALVKHDNNMKDYSLVAD